MSQQKPTLEQVLLQNHDFLDAAKNITKTLYNQILEDQKIITALQEELTKIRNEDNLKKGEARIVEKAKN